MQNKKPYKSSTDNPSFVYDKDISKNALESQSYLGVLNWMEDYQEFMARFQSKEDYQNSMKIKGNKYGVYTQEVIDKIYELRKIQQI